MMWDRVAARALTEKRGPSQRDALLMAEFLPPALDAIDRVLALHRRLLNTGYFLVPVPTPANLTGLEKYACGLCLEVWPCATVRALDGEQ